MPKVFATPSFLEVDRDRVAIVDGSRGIDPPVSARTGATRRVAIVERQKGAPWFTRRDATERVFAGILDRP